MEDKDYGIEGGYYDPTIWGPLNERLDKEENKKSKHYTPPQKDMTRIDGGEFSREFRENTIMALDTENLSEGALAFLKRFEYYAKNKNNCIIINEDVPSIELLCKKINFGKTKLSKVLGELETKGFIKRGHDGRKMIIYINPWLTSAWFEVSTDVANLFANKKTFGTH